ncbi:DUF4062 domain-containing protein [Treponema sp.]|uniref:DUF4062 domain-containing protein n=1 Tax=Treponema sp. TaxID=166 RepID=UPI00298E758B|nr:DUF4062 domain-containing protein [Treponema sp.]
MKKKLQIFISSTYKDLIVERQAAVETVLKSGNIPAGMELFTAGDESQLETITRWIDESDIYMLILGGRYGSIEPISGKSYTEAEYDYARSLGKPFFAIVLSDKYLEEKASEDSSFIETTKSNEIKLFKQKVLSSICRIVDTQNDIKLAIHETLQDFKDRYEFSGWVQGSKEENYSELLEENHRLRKELDKLKKDDEKKVRVKKEPENDFEEIYSLFQNSFALSEKGKSKKINLNEVILENSSSLVTGVTNQYGMSDSEKLLFFRIFPLLAVHELAKIENVPRVNYRRYSLTPKGRQYVAFLQKKIVSSKEVK